MSTTRPMPAAVTTAAVTFADVLAAHERIKPSIYRSPTPYSLMLSRLCGFEAYCKLDHLQVTGSFKERGARNSLEQLDAAQRARGVIAASAGNHALALAYHGQELNVPVTVVMPTFAPLTKVSNCRSFGAEVILHGDSFDDSKTHAYALAESRGLTYIHGFNDPAIIAGAGTIGVEILQDVPDVDAVVIPVGGGGLVAGCALAIKSMNPKVRVIGVEPAHAPTLRRSLDAGHVVKAATTPTLADGLAVAEVGANCFELARQHMDELVLVDEKHLALAVLRLLEMEKAVVEGAGAAALAGVLQHDLGLAGKKVALVVCGGNIDLTTVSKVIERGLAADGRIARFTVSISDRPGGLAKLARVIADTGASVREIEHDRAFASSDVGHVYVNVVVDSRDRQHIAEMTKAIEASGIQVIGDGDRLANSDA